MKSALSLKQLKVRLGGNVILQHLDAEIAPGEFVGIFGPNGAGKSTLVRAILGLCPITDGTVEIFGRHPGKLNREIGYMPQSRTNLDGVALSARAMVAAVQGGDRWGLPRITLRGADEVHRALELAGALPYADRPFSVLSGGERQRVALAQALLGRPRLLILDEPLASLDPRNQMLLVDRVEEIRRETGATILFIAHDVNPLLRVMDRVLYVAGKSAVLGDVDEVMSSDTLTRLYGCEIQVIRAEGRIFIVSAEGNVTEAARHD